MNVLDAFFPGICLLCRRRSRRDVDLCRDCEAALERNERACPVCAEPAPPGSEAGEVCGSCIAAPPPWTATVAPFTYAPPMSRVVECLKSGNGLREARILGAMLTPAIRARYRGDALPDALIAMPLTRRRRRERGYNQAELLAQVVGKEIDRPVQKGVLVRTRDAPPQRTLPRSARLRNVRGAFDVRRSLRERLLARMAEVLPKRVALVDDVTTTGATVRAATQALLAADVAEVHIWVAAKTPTSRAVVTS
ncbi:MAG: ComF family protein [Gammaproteobacteria bacterium]|nr:ComF family protein [Gammaproteobacteria bacterium]MXY55267.1 ComF family protein [Gammaproteobacteria bacterium]MYF29306.1 ComF family protein [Gammaproteobacteria bacterium]MYK46886.1 ComF family protein [Gammaproteobacteria bacterium]